ncbi:MAG TPA: PAS domain S-box protein [Deltaproteobacteria bacterium]|jgi:PAS domain S-box-containing protein|nr:PAS domain S-box protein [Deltaproteobacteria bacterium]HQI01349.1 PAS domain S-box protein [Deltaproteobacteria bacterium]HQJ08078.1 PAS domain S-box protein [Deltaproteobacteria bacterium]
MRQDPSGKNTHKGTGVPVDCGADGDGANKENAGTVRGNETLPDGESIFFQMFHRNPACMGIVTMDGQVLEVNQRFLDVYGYAREDLIGRTAAEMDRLLSPEADRILNEFFIKGSLRDYEVDVIDRSGDKHSAVVSLEPISYRGSPSILVMFFDVTELRNTQEALRTANEELENKVHRRTENLRKIAVELEEQKEVLQKVFDKIPIMLIFHDSLKRVSYINPEFERLIGWSLEEIKSMDLLEACFPDPEYRRKAWDFMMAAKGIWRDFEIMTRSGVSLPSSWANVRFSDGTQVGIGVDITSRKAMEADLMRLASAVEHAGEGIALLGREMEIHYFNPAFEKIAGYKLQEVIGKNLMNFPDYLANDRYKEWIDQIGAEGKIWSGLQKRGRRNGEIMDLNLTIAPIRDKTGKLDYFVTVARDVTQEMKLQQHIAQVQKIEALGTLAGGIAHDLKNTFTPILINSRLMLENVHTDDPAYPILGEILQAAHHGLDLVDQILTFNHPEAYEKSPVVLSIVIKEALSFIRSTLPSAIIIRHNLDSNRDMILADPIQIKQVLINLASNAGYAMRKKSGLLNILISRTILSAKEASKISPDLARGSYIQVVVRDTGEGMTEEVRKRIFEPFFTTKRKEEGSGMGLAVVHGIIKGHQGAITVKSRPGKGSTFTILLPVFEEGTASEGPAPGT